MNYDEKYEAFKRSLPPMTAEDYEEIIKEWVENNERVDSTT
jgi:hypothetical protein